MIKSILTFLFAMLLTWSFADKPKDEVEPGPWFTGPLLTPSATNLDPGSSNVQPYLFYTDFDSHSGPHTYTLDEANYVQFGILSWLDTTIFFHVLYNEKLHSHSFGYGDTSITFGFPLLRQVRHTPTPSIRLSIQETFPTGKFRNLDPEKLGIDSFGGGSFRTKIAIDFAKLVFWVKHHPMNFRLYIPISIPSLVQVRGFHSYGGGYNTYGKVRPSYIFAPCGSIEVSLTKNWVYAMDICYEYDSKTSFSGNPGTDIDGNEVSNENKSSQIFSIAPAIEYNVTENFGYIAGVWFTLATKNSSDFVSYIFSFTYTF